MLWKFQTQVTQGQVTRSRQVTSSLVKWPHLNIVIGHLRSCQFCDLSSLHYKSIKWEKTENHLFWTKTILNTLKHRATGKIDTLNRKVATSDLPSWPQGHFRLWKVTGSFSAIPFDRGKLKRWKHLDLVKATIQIDWYATWPFRSGKDLDIDIDLGQRFNMIFWGQFIVHSTHLNKRNTMLAKWMSCLY